MIRLRSYVNGAWREGRRESAVLLNPATEEPLAATGTDGIDFAAALDHARNVGGPAMRELTFAQRGALLRSIYDVLYAHREELLDLSVRNGGNTRNDAKFDIDGATGTLLAYSDYGGKLGDRALLVDGESERLGRNPRYAGKHILTPLAGAAVHINAYNFPAWGFMEKAAVAWLAGMPVITKPATSTALLAYRMMELVVAARVLPEGALTFVAGSTGDLLDHLGPQDALAFTGSGDTARRLRSLDAHVGSSMRINVEADSLNAAILGPDVGPGNRGVATDDPGCHDRHTPEGRPEVHRHSPGSWSLRTGSTIASKRSRKNSASLPWAIPPILRCAWVPWSMPRSCGTSARALTPSAPRRSG